jgi:hypothetical protein
MKFICRDLLTLICGITIGSVSNAATLDIASYLGLNPGAWAVLQDARTGAISGYSTSQTSPGTVTQTWYRFDGSTWVFDTAETFAITARKVSYVSTADRSATLLFQPPVNLPRRQQVGDSTVHKGVLLNQSTGETIEVTNAISLTAEGISLVVPAGGFSDCIKLRLSTYGGGTSRDSVSISCPNRSEVKTWYNKIKDSTVPTEEDQSDSHSLVMIQAGDSNSPFP